MTIIIVTNRQPSAGLSPAPPVAYLIDERGVISKDVAVGGDAILRLVSG